MQSSGTGRTTTPRAVPATAGSRERLLADLRRRGARGGIIAPHRAMAGERFTLARAASILALAPLLAVGVALALQPLGVAWTWLFRTLHPLLALPGEVVVDTVRLGPFPPFDVPSLTTAALAPTPDQWMIVGALWGVALLASFVLPARFLPLAYFLRFAAFVQATAFLFFALRGDAFPYLLPQYLLGFFRAGIAMLVLIPIALGLTYFPFSLGLPRKLALTVLAVGHAAVLLPLQVLLHAYLIHHLSLLVMPTLFFLFGMLLQIAAFVALYGWGMSWGTQRREVRA